MKELTEDAVAARFLLGGIGTGNISLDQNARLCDFELWNSPNKGFRSPYTFFAIRTEQPGGAVCVKALESRLAPPFMHAHGTPVQDLGGFSRFRHSLMKGDLPFVHFTLTDKNIPVTAELEAFTPFIPL
ncbi:MAG: GH116 family glycosyl-hydrolase, partial [Treponema sp.]|nr:GH116 family glycosyl-hydrolase [Treponema sp.]